jgi:molecular chaperone DnaJ
MEAGEDLSAFFGDLFGTIFGRSFATGDVWTDVRISESDAISGVTREIDIQRWKLCTTCKGHVPQAVGNAQCIGCRGTGMRTHTQGFFTVQRTCDVCKVTAPPPCTTCKGTLGDPEPATVSITIPAGTEHGSSIEFPALGSLMPDGTRGTLHASVLIGDRPDTRQADMIRDLMPPDLPRAEVRRPLRHVEVSTVFGIIAIVAMVLWIVLD